MKYFDQFINEAKKSEMVVGDYVLFTKNTKEYQTIGYFAKIVEIIINSGDSKTFQYVVEFDGNGAPRKSYNFRFIKKMTLTKNQIGQLITHSTKEYELIKSKKIVKIQYSTRLELVLLKMNIKIPEHTYLDISFLDIDPEKDNMITYLPAVKLDVVYIKDSYSSKLRQSMKIGGFFKKIYPKIDNVVLENLVNTYRNFWTSINKKSNEVQIITGEEIRHWYLRTNYKEPQVGGLWRSCMRHQGSQHRLKIYCENVDRIALAIIVDENMKLLCRAMLWKLSEPEGKIYLDRTYSIDIKYDLMMQEKAKKEGWLYYGKDDHKKRVDLDKNFGSSSKNPYMDTFKYYNIENKNYYLTSYTTRYTSHHYNDHD